MMTFSHIKTIIKHDLYFSNYSFRFAGILIAAFLNYLLHPLLGRIMPPSLFGDIQTFVLLLAESTVIFSAFSLITINITANSRDIHERNLLISHLRKIAFGISIFLFAILVVCAPTLKLFFNLSSVLPIFAIAIILPINAINVFRSAYLQGGSFFARLAKSDAFLAICRLVFSCLLVLFGWGIGGALLGIVLANIAAAYYLFMQTTPLMSFDNEQSGSQDLSKILLKNEYEYGALALFSIGLITLFYTIDVLIVKKYFDALTAGLYSGISVIAKIIFFMIGPTATILLSLIKINDPEKQNRKIFKKSLLLSFFIGTICMIAFYFFHDLIIHIMIGERYVPMAYLLPHIGLVMFLAGIMNVFTNYYLALRRFFVLKVSIGAMLATFSILFYFHDSIEIVLNSLIIILIIINLLFASIYAKENLNNNSNIQ